MKSITELTKAYKSVYAAAKALKTNQTQLQRWVHAGAMVDADGNVWIKTKGKIDAS